MGYNYNKESFNKGQAFEDYVEEVLFPKEGYDLLHKTNSYQQNSQRFVENSKNPDFKFRCKLTGQEFHVEAKYRSKPYKNQYDTLSKAQVNSFPELHSTEVPIYIVLGYGDQAENPEYVSLIPFAEHQEEKISVAKAQEYRIPKKSVSSSLIHQDNSKEAAHLNKQAPHPPKDSITKRKQKSKLLLVVSMFIISLSIASITYFKYDQEDILKERITTYYQLSDANNLQELSNYISPELTYWYGIKKPSINEVLENIREYREKNPYSKSEIDWDSFDITEKPTGDFYATYKLNYQVKGKKAEDFRVFHLKVLTIWDEDLKLKSIKELH